MVGPDSRAALRIHGRSLHPGDARARVLVLDEPLSFWGGVDPKGTIVDHHHPQQGASLTGRVVVMPSGRGSSSSAAVLAELVRSQTGPAALLLAECDTILVTGALVAAEMYGMVLPVVQAPAPDLARLRPDTEVIVSAGPAGELCIVEEPAPVPTSSLEA